MTRIPSKKIIWLFIVLMVLTIGLFWWVGSNAKKKEEAKLEQYYQEIINKEKNIEKVVRETDKTEDNKIDLIINNNWQAIQVKTTLASSTEKLKQYGLDLGQALAPLSEKRESETKATYQALNQNDPTELQKVVSSRLIHEKTVTQIQNLVVPIELADYQRQLIHSLQNSIKLLLTMEQALDKPEQALESSRLWIEENLLFHQTMVKLGNYLTSRQIQFDDNDKIKTFLKF